MQHLTFLYFKKNHAQFSPLHQLILALSLCLNTTYCMNEDAGFTMKPQLPMRAEEEQDLNLKKAFLALMQGLQQ